tara:strand:- start:482 stop:679 length:198 start_codon:yes stop_codon:yes gene_type:complete
MWEQCSFNVLPIATKQLTFCFPAFYQPRKSGKTKDNLGAAFNRAEMVIINMLGKAAEASDRLNAN